MCVYATGSFGRLEACKYSDLDLFFLQFSNTDKVSRISKTLIDAEVINICRKAKFPEFTADGKYLEMHSLDDILSELGSPEDDYRNYFTARMLLLLESKPLFSVDVYYDTLKKVIDSYYVDYHDHEKNFRPIFLLNDILRFWKTLCLNYEHRRNRPPKNIPKKREAHLKNLKLKFSRMTTCYSMVLLLAHSDHHAISPDEVLGFAKLTPTQRLEYLAQLEPKKLKSSVGEVMETYSWFLEKTGVEEGQAVEWLSDRKRRELAFARARDYHKGIYNILVKIVADSSDFLRFLAI